MNTTKQNTEKATAPGLSPVEQNLADARATVAEWSTRSQMALLLARRNAHTGISLTLDYYHDGINDYCYRQDYKLMNAAQDLLDNQLYDNAACLI